MEASRCFQEPTKDSAPSDCRVAASFVRSTPAFLNAARTDSASPPLRGSTPVTAPWSPKASRVSSGMVLTVLGEASALMYSVSGAAGSFTPVLA